MKKTLFGFILIIISVGLHAQTYYPFPTDTAQWSIGQYSSSPSPSSWTNHESVIGDTIINQLHYNKVYYNQLEDYSISEQFLKCFIREDTTKKVYVKYPFGSQEFPDTNEFVLYDFNLAVGDTFQTTCTFYQAPFLGQIKFILDSIDSIITNTGFRKRYNYSFVSFMEFNYFLPNNLYIIEGIGSNLGPFFNEFIQNYYTEFAWISELICFRDQQNYVIGGTNCDIVGINENQQQAFTVNAYPNPASDKITFVYKLPENINNASIKLYNAMGIPVIEIPLLNEQNSISTEVSDLNQGIYFYKLCNEKQSYQGKSILIIR